MHEDIIERLLNAKLIKHRQVSYLEERLGNDPFYFTPSNSYCFNKGQYTIDDFYDWLEGTGRIVKGETQEEKDKFYYLHQFLEESDPYIGITTLYYYPYFDLIKDYGSDSVLSVGNYTDEQIICSLFSRVITQCLSDNGRLFDMLQGAELILKNIMSDKIEQIESFAKIALVYGTYLRMKQYNTVTLPDFEFIT